MGMSESIIHPVILCGGSGTRLWPLSRATYPKQFLRLYGNHTMVQETVRRFVKKEFYEPLLICNESHRFILAEQLRQIGLESNRLILEPVGRNTAPAAAIAALMLTQVEDDPLMLLTPADHVIVDNDRFLKAILSGAPLARRGFSMTFGVVPDAPKTGYGYIKQGTSIDDGYAYEVSEFVEKPDKHLAQSYVDKGNYFWNSGIFLFSCKTYISELERLRPDILDACKSSLEAAKEENDFLRLPVQTFSEIKGSSIDYAVMEQCEKAAVIPIDVGWSDIGSWDALWEISNKDHDGNTTEGNVVQKGSINSYIRSDGPLVVAQNLQEMSVIASKDAIFISPRAKSEKFSELIDVLSKQKYLELTQHTRTLRPWGSFEELKLGENFKVKLLEIKPGASISLQFHRHRSEHWVVVGGRARITRDTEIIDLDPNESTYVAEGVRHRLENPGTKILHVVEVQSGTYLGEDDIVRLEDRYGRI